MNDERLDYLIDQHLSGAMSDETRRELDERLLHSAADRARFWELAETHVLLHEGLQSKLGQPAPRVRHRPSVWLSWPPLTAAAAGLLFGLFGATVVWAVTSPRMVTTAARLFALADGSFENHGGRVPSGFPVKTSVWSGDECEIVEDGQGIVRDGRRALRFQRAEGNAPNSAADACDVFQLVDLRSLREELKAAGDSILELSAEFFDARTAPGVPVVFACHIYLFEGSEASLQAVWPPTARDTLGVGANYILSNGGPGAGGWRKVTARCVLNSQVDIAVVKLSAGRGDRRGGPSPELGSQFADDVKLVLKTQPPLPVRTVQH